MQSFAVIVPVLNPGAWWEQWLSRLGQQICQPNILLVIDSHSTDNVLQTWVLPNQRTLKINRAEFNHGGTRHWAVEQLADQVEVVVFLTQDALLATPHALCRMLDAFADPAVAVAYGRQLPHLDAGPIGAHARYFNYDEHSRIKSIDQITTLGIKTCFTSNSFAAYRVSDLLELGGFPRHVILSEDTYVAAKAILNGKSIAYVADATVYHSHDYSSAEEFRRYFDIGVFHASEPWLMESFGGAEGEGGRFVRSELSYLFRHAFYLIPMALFRTLVKWVGYRLGKIYRYLPISWCRRLSMHKKFWEQAHTEVTHV